jgi:hypothetical protein
MNDLPVPDDVLEDWLGGPKHKESTMKYLITYYYKNDLEQRYQRHHSMQMALAVANLLIAKGDYVVDSITTEYS